MSIDYGRYFSEDELKCKETGECNMNQEFVDKLNLLRDSFGKPLMISSGFRSTEHSVEKRKANPLGSPHPSGRAVDLLLHGKDAFDFLHLVMQSRLMTGIGFSQKGNRVSRFIHIDDLEQNQSRPRPHIWSY